MEPSTYSQYRDSELWIKIDEILSDLEENQDIDIRTVREYIIGYFCQKMITSGLVKT
jgi:hypothetical protein